MISSPLSSSSSSSTSPPSLTWLNSIPSLHAHDQAPAEQVSRRRALKGAYKLRREDSGEVIGIDQTPFIVGRGHRCNLRIKHDQVSSTHCILHFFSQFDDVFLEDCSSNGTYVNGERVDSVALLPRHARIGITKQHVYVLESSQSLAEGTIENLKAAGKNVHGNTEEVTGKHLRIFEDSFVPSKAGKEANVQSGIEFVNPALPITATSKHSLTKKKRARKVKSKSTSQEQVNKSVGPLFISGEHPIQRITEQDLVSWTDDSHNPDTSASLEMAPVKTSSEWPLVTRGPSPLQLAIDFAARKGGGEGVEGMRKELLGTEERSALKSAEARKIGKSHRVNSSGSQAAGDSFDVSGGRRSSNKLEREGSDDTAIQLFAAAAASSTKGSFSALDEIQSFLQPPDQTLPATKDKILSPLPPRSQGELEIKWGWCTVKCRRSRFLSFNRKCFLRLQDDSLMLKCVKMNSDIALQCFMSLDAKKVLMLDVKQWQAALCPRNSRRLYLTWQPAGGELGKSWEDLPHPSADVSPYGLLDFPLGRGLFELTLRSEEERGDWYLLLLSRSECARASYLA
ncbi:hypothetical protein GUITHDRAFT_116941 [Guillardia theta CCMP2712]|uniref:FHA domain-containing protein n=1 Tax=Guillardia theta (strain CCMP2712) TaxID=905079 RepID=L1IKY6_GUITC|nr:hypothetical protein GUITHDRAFT_116941 [Guillardia theta CCMP2712]EKX36918.1 hypothetical protein GUITHDRAFT_116941 [Guillardia theta CCMP2712]|eukprot:XP_005823898.1 hypothetical protein GUITHDRAFT_116941 [Guillardia theta CCMP2712]